MRKVKALCQFLLETKTEILVRKQKVCAEMFEEEVALNNIVFAIDKALEKIKGEN